MREINTSYLCRKVNSVRVTLVAYSPRDLDRIPAKAAPDSGEGLNAVFYEEVSTDVGACSL